MNLNILTKDKNFAIIDPKNLSIDKTIACIEFGIDILDNISKITIRNKVTNGITIKINKIKLINHDEELVKNFRSTRTFLKKNADIIITKADKGNTAIIMNKRDYVK